MKPDREIPRAPVEDAGTQHAERPVLYFPACGALCDAFWWARRRTIADADPAGSPVSDRSDGR
jgi:hypothetical protein